MDTLKSRLPSRAEILAVLSVVVFVNFSWSIGRMFWYMPSWLYFMGVWELLPVLAYVLAYALFESLLVLAGITALGFILPRPLLRAKFAAQGSMMVLLLSLAMFALFHYAPIVMKWTPRQISIAALLAVTAILVLAVLLSFLLVRVKVFERGLLALANQLSVFAYLYVPLGLLGLVVIFFRNLF